jgi:hypothetical protein
MLFHLRAFFPFASFQPSGPTAGLIHSPKWMVGGTLLTLSLLLPQNPSFGQCCCCPGTSMQMSMMNGLLVQRQLMTQQLLSQQLQQSATLRSLLLRMSTADTEELKKTMKQDQAELRWAAAWTVGNRELPLQNELIALLSDRDPLVRQAARQSLVRLSAAVTARRGGKAGSRARTVRGVDFGPAANANPAARARAASRWRDWWNKQDDNTVNAPTGSISSLSARAQR